MNISITQTSPTVVVVTIHVDSFANPHIEQDCSGADDFLHDLHDAMEHVSEAKFKRLTSTDPVGQWEWVSMALIFDHADVVPEAAKWIADYVAEVE